MKLSELLKQDFKKPPLYATDIKFIDETLNGGFELGQIITISGDSEAGKTKLLEQILTQVSLGYKCLYFAFEFNTYQVWKYFKYKLEKGYITQQQAENIEIISTDEIDTETNTVIAKINEHIIKDNVTFVGIDSTLNLYLNGNIKGQEEVTEIFRLLQKLAISKNILLFLITQSTKEENKEGRIGIFGSQKAKHFVNMMIHIFYDKEKKERQLVFDKNKQNGKWKKWDIYFDEKTLTFDTWLGEYKVTQTNTKELEKLGIKVEDSSVDSEKIDKLATKGFKFE